MAGRPIVLATVSAIGGAVLATLLMSRGHDADEAKVSALQERLEALESLAPGPQAATGVPGTVGSREQGAPPATRDHADTRPGLRAGTMPDEPTAPPPFMDPAAAAEQRQNEARALEATLSAERLDVAATNTFAQGLTEAFGGVPELAGNQLIDTQCRETLCRIALLHRSEEDVDSFLSNVGSLPGLENTESYWQRVVNADGSSVMTMYVARQGHRLPDYQTPGGPADRSHPGF
jgi:hypothetical protein